MSFDNLVSGYMAFRGCQFMLMPACMVFILLCLGAMVTCGEYSKESSMKKQYGAAWKEHYEAEYGSLKKGRTNVVVGVGGAVVGSVIGVAIYRMMAPQGKIKPRRRRR